mgnify:FL=1
MHPAVVLGVPLMDADHATIELMLERVATTSDRDLPALFAEIEAEVTAHFAREEVLMAEHRAPVAHCHQAQHALLLGEFAAARPIAEAGDAAALRAAFDRLAECVAGHVAKIGRAHV